MRQISGTVIAASFDTSRRLVAPHRIDQRRMSRLAASSSPRQKLCSISASFNGFAEPRARPGRDAVLPPSFGPESISTAIVEIA
jgi:hypothetical protein